MVKKKGKLSKVPCVQFHCVALPNINHTMKSAIREAKTVIAI